MPGPAACNKIKDPVERKKCLAYKGKYAQAGPVKGQARARKTRPVTGGGGY